MDYPQLRQRLANEEDSITGTVCANFRSTITYRLLEIYKCDLPSSHPTNLMQLLQGKVNRFNRFVRFELALIEGVQAVEAYDELMAICLDAFVNAEIMKGTTVIDDKSLATASPAPTITGINLPTVLPPIDIPAMPSRSPTTHENRTEATDRRTKRPSRRKTQTPTPKPKPTDTSEFANTTLIAPQGALTSPPDKRFDAPSSPSETNPFNASLPPLQPKAEEPATLHPTLSPSSTAKAAATSVPTPSETPVKPDEVGSTKAGSNDATEGISDRLATEFNEMSRQLYAMSSALTLVLALMVSSMVLAVGIFAWRSCRARNRSSEYQPLFPVHPFLDNTN